MRQTRGPVSTAIRHKKSSQADHCVSGVAATRKTVRPCRFQSRPATKPIRFRPSILRRKVAMQINRICRRPGCEPAPRSRPLAISVPSMHTRNINCESPGVSVSRTNCVSLNFLLQHPSASAPKRHQIMSRAIRSSKCRVANCAPFSRTSSRPAMRKYVASQESSTSVSMRASKPGWSST